MARFETEHTTTLKLSDETMDVLKRIADALEKQNGDGPDSSFADADVTTRRLTEGERIANRIEGQK